MKIMSAARLVRRAEFELGQVTAEQDVTERFLHAHMAALRASGAVLELHLSPRGPRSTRRVRSAWVQLAEAGPEWEPWATYFAQGAHVRAAIEAGRSVDLAAGEAEELVAAATDFLVEVQAAVATAIQPSSIAS